MRDYEKLVKRLRICPDYNDGCKNCPHEHDLGCRSTTMREAADAIEELASKPKWIPVTERLPEDKRDVQITVFWHGAWRTMYGYYDGEYWHLYAPMHTEVPDVEVIGWMEKPAPLPPKEGK